MDRTRYWLNRTRSRRRVLIGERPGGCGPARSSRLIDGIGAGRDRRGSPGSVARPRLTAFGGAVRRRLPASATRLGLGRRCSAAASARRGVGAAGPLGRRLPFRTRRTAPRVRHRVRALTGPRSPPPRRVPDPPAVAAIAVAASPRPASSAGGAGSAGAAALPSMIASVSRLSTSSIDRMLSSLPGIGRSIMSGSQSVSSSATTLMPSFRASATAICSRRGSMTSSASGSRFMWRMPLRFRSIFLRSRVRVEIIFLE